MDRELKYLPAARQVASTLIFLILFSAFMEGGLSLIGLPISLTRMLRYMMILSLFIYILFIKEKSFPGYGYILLLAVICIVSMRYNGTSYIELFLFSLRFLFPILFFWSIYNCKTNTIYFYRYLIILTAIQIPVIIVKFFILGVTESGAIGTLSINSGSLSAIFPLVVIPFLLAAFFISNKRKYLIFILLYIIFGLIGGKRALIAYLPLILLITLFFYSKQLNTQFSGRLIKLGAMLAVFAVIGFYLAVRVIPALNPEEKVWGSFNIDHVIDHSLEYNTATYELGFSRFDAPEVALIFLNQIEPLNLYLGLGPGDIIQSSLRPDVIKDVQSDRELLLYKYGLGYGLSIGLLWTGLQIGILGVLIYCAFIFSIGRRVYKKLKYSKDPLFSVVIIGFLGMVGVFFIDYFTYSSTFVTESSVIIPFYLIAASILKEEDSFSFPKGTPKSKFLRFEKSVY